MYKCASSMSVETIWHPGCRNSRDIIQINLWLWLSCRIYLLCTNIFLNHFLNFIPNPGFMLQTLSLRSNTVESSTSLHFKREVGRGGGKERIISPTQWKSPLSMPSNYFNTHFSSGSYNHDLIANALPKFILNWNCPKIAANVDSCHFTFNQPSFTFQSKSYLNGKKMFRWSISAPLRLLNLHTFKIGISKGFAHWFSICWVPIIEWNK